MRNSVILVLSLWFCITYAQDPELKTGFSLLETGAFAEAETYFGDFLELNPDDRTAQICYGRAVGLNGRPEISIQLFDVMLSKNPSDLEIQLNYAEAHLWMDDALNAKTLYEKLWQADSTDFAVALGYANTLSSLGMNRKALRQIDKALTLKEHDQALISKKYILLGNHVDARDLGNLEEAHLFLDALADIFPNDIDMLISRAVLNLLAKDFSGARRLYARVHEMDNDHLEALLGLSYTNMILMKESAGMEYAQLAMNRLDSINDIRSAIRIQINFINLLGYSYRFKKAHQIIDELIERHGALPDLVNTKARLHLWAGELEQARDISMNSGLEQAGNYELLLGAAEIALARKELQLADTLLSTALQLNPNRREASNLLANIDQKQHASIEVAGNINLDNSGNLNIQTGVVYRLPQINRTGLRVGMAHHWAKDKMSSQGLNRYQLHAGIQWSQHYRFTLDSHVGVEYIQDGLRGNQFNWNLNTTVQFRTHRSHYIGLKLEHFKYDHFAELIRSDIKVTSLSLQYNKMFRRGISLYAVGGQRYFSNDNNRIWLDVSVSKSVIRFIRIGMNANYQHFKRVNEVAYYSPAHYRSTQGFFRYEFKNYEVRKWSMLMQVSTGIQQEQDQDIRWTYGWELGAGGRIGDRMVMQATFSGTNASSKYAATYTYYSFKWSLNHLFKK